MTLLVACIALGAVGNASADQQATDGKVAQASIDPRPIRLPMTDGADIRFHRFTVLEGPSKSNAGPFVQDDQGFVWFGTPYGLNRFDGYSFKVYTHDHRNPKSISSSFVNSLFKDRSGTLWAACDQFLNKFDSATETFSRYPVPYVFHMNEDAARTLWLATPTGLYALNPANGGIRRYSHDPSDPTSLESDDIKSSGEDREGTFWVATSEGLDAFDRNTRKVTLHIPIYEAGHVLSFYEDRFGVFWIYHSSGNALAVFDRKTNTLRQFSFREEHGLTLTGITGMLEDQSGSLWLATNGAGMLKFDREHRRFIRYRHRPNDPESLVQDSIHSVFQDREGVIWASLGGFGLTRFTSRALPFKRYRHDFGNPEDRDEPFVGAILEDRQGMLWIGTHDALHRIDRGNERYTDFHLTSAGEGTDAITMCEDRQGNLWIGTYDHGLFRFEPRTGRFKRFQHNPADPHSLSNDIIPRVFVDHSGTVWAATYDGLDRFEAATGGFTTYKIELQGVRPYYLDLAEDREGILWLGTESSGLVRFDPEKKQFTIYQHEADRPGSLSNNRVNSVHFARSGTMWVGTQEGLNRFDAATGKFAIYSQPEGLPGNDVGCVLEDSSGGLWMSTDNGVAQLNPETQAMKSYSTADGLPGPDLTGWGTCFQSKAGEMFFGGFSGATAFFPKDVVDSEYVPAVALTDFRLFGTEVELGDKSPLKKTINYTNTIVLSRSQDVFSIGFSALSYLNPSTNRYRYMLENLDRNWSVVGSDRRFATYTTLPAGKYTFRVQGATSRGPWSEPGAILHIEILPGWQSTWWFRVTSLAASLALLWGLYEWRVQQLRSQEKHLREVINAVPASVWSTSQDGAVDFVNERWRELTGLSPEEGLGWNWEEVVHPDDRVGFVKHWREALKNGQAMEHEVRVRGRDGEYRWLFVRNVPLRDEKGKIVKWYGTSFDVEDRKRAEQALRRSETYLAEAQRLTHTGSWAWNLRTNELFWSQELCRMYGLDPAIKPAWPWFLNRVHPEDRRKIEQQAKMESTEKNWTVSEIEFRVVLSDGTVKDVHAISYRVTDDSGETTEVIGTVMDVTDRKRTERERERLRQLEADLAHINRVSMMGELAASLAHEIRQPITAAATNARTSLRWLQRDPPEIEEASQTVSRVVSDVNRAAEIISHLRSLYSKDAPSERELVNVNEVACEMLTLLRSEAHRFSISMRTELAVELPQIKADRVQLQQVFMNLMLNGIEAMKDMGGELTVRSERNGDGEVLISIKDTGVGLPTEKIDQIFSAFFTTKSQGTGMGLSISRTIVESHGGRLWASPNTGRGATFQFTLPTEVKASSTYA